MSVKNTIQFLPGIDGISRKFARRVDTCSDKEGKVYTRWIGAGIKIGPTKHYKNRQLNYLQFRKFPISTPPTSNQLWAMTRFGAVSALVKARKEDLMNVNTDKAAFLAQINDANGVKSFKAYLWKICTESYDTQHPRQ